MFEANHQMSREKELLLLCSRVEMRESEVRNLRKIAASDLDWQYLLAMAHYHRVLPLLHHNVNTHVPHGPPADVRGRLREMVMQNGARNLFLRSWLISITTLFKEQGIPVLAFKGPVLAEDIYGNIGYRIFSDLDFLISRRDVKKMVLRLRGLGFRQDIDLSPDQYEKLVDKFHHAMLAKDGVIVELHWELTGRYFFKKVGIDMLLPRAVEVEVAGDRLQTLGSEDLLVYLSVHGCRHHWLQLDAVCCIAELVKKKPHLDWDLAWRLARQLGASKMLLLGLVLARDMLGLALPVSIAGLLAEYPKLTNMAKDIAEKMLSTVEAPPMPMSYREYVVFHYGVMDNRLDWLRYCLKSLFNPTHSDWMWLRFPASLSGVYYIVRPLRLLGKYSRNLIK